MTTVSDGFRDPLGSGILTPDRYDSDGYYSAQEYGQFNSLFGGYHLGEDWNGDGGRNTDLGDPVYAASNGYVTQSGVLAGLGEYIVIRHDLPQPITYAGVTTTEVFTLYGHLDPGTRTVFAGDTVTKGDLIGDLGTSGSGSTLAHLHFEVRLGASYTSVQGYSSTSRPTGWADPIDFINSYRTISGSSPNDPDLIADSFTVSATSVDANGTLDFVWEVANIGNGDMTASATSGVYLSTNSTITTADQLLHQEGFSTLLSGERDTNESQSSVALPSGIAPGTYWVGVIADNGDTNNESNENNNASNAIQITITGGGGSTGTPDIAVQNVVLNSTTYQVGETVLIDYDITNVGTGDATNNGSAIIRLSTDSTLSADDITLGSESFQTLAAGATDNEDQNRALPGDLAAGDYWIFVGAEQVAGETNLGNNISSGTRITVGGQIFTDGDDNVTLSTAGTYSALSGNDTVNGSGGSDTINGNSGDDTLSGAGGNDFLFGQGGRDIIRGGASVDNISGGAGADMLFGDGGNDVIDGDSGGDTISGGGDDDTLFGGNGADTLNGGTGNDTLNGEGFTDILNGGAGDDILSGGGSADQLFGDADDDTLSGNNGRDDLNGGSGNDILNGGRDNDELRGGSGNDELLGSTGDDQLYGDDGADTFQFRANHGSDRIFDFEQGTDVIQFNIGSVNDISDLTFTNVFAGVDISYGSGSIRVLGSNDTDFTNADFEFL